MVPSIKKRLWTVGECPSRARKLAPAFRDLSYVERITAIDLPSLYYKRARGDMIKTYKHMSGIYAVDAEYIKPDKSFTRRSQLQFKEKKDQWKISGNNTTATRY